MSDVTYTEAVGNGNVLQPTGTALAASLALADAKPEETILIVSNSDDDTALTFTVQAGDSPPALAAADGDLAVTVAFGTSQIIGPLESYRFLQSDGSLSMTASPTTGHVIALHVPSRF